MSPDLAEAITLAIASGWMLHLYRSQEAGRVVLFSALYLGLPAIALGIQAAGLLEIIEPAKWVVVTVNAALTAAMISSTRHRTHPTVLALARVEEERIREARQADRRSQEREERAEVRGRVYALAALCEGHEPLHIAL
jgi:hypothetical protein